MSRESTICPSRIERADAKAAARQKFDEALADQAMHGVADRRGARAESIREPAQLEDHARREGALDNLEADAAIDKLRRNGFRRHHVSPSCPSTPVFRFVAPALLAFPSEQGLMGHSCL